MHTSRYIKAPKDASSDLPELRAAAEATREAAREAASVGTYASEGGGKFVFRVKKEGAHGGYKIITEVRQRPSSIYTSMITRTCRHA
jgi:hypothetical protein